MVGAALLAVLAVGGCSGTPSAAPRTEPSIPPLPASGDPSKPVDFQAGGASIRPDGSMTLPLDALESAEDGAVIARAQTVLAQECMRGKGLELPAAFRLDRGPEPPAPYVVYGLISLENAKAYGYRDPSSFDKPDGGPAPGPEADEKVSPEVVEAFFGVPKAGKTGCEGEALKKLGGETPRTLSMFLQELRSQAMDATFHDSRVTAVVSRWSACMKESGNDYPNPQAPAHDRTLLGRGLPTPAGATLPPPSPDEIAVAVADVTCKRRTQYLQTVAVVNAAYQQGLLDRRAKDVQDEQRRHKERVAAARKVLGTG